VAFILSYDTATFIQPTSVSFGDTVTYTLDVTNNSSTDFFGAVSFFRRVGNGQADLIFTESFSDTIAAFASKPFVLTDTVSALRFGGGINAVVVWPTAPGVVTLDTAYGHLEVKVVGIPEEMQDAYRMVVFPNPTAGSVRFQAEWSPLRARETVLMDQQGRRLRTENGLPGEMDLSGLPAGVYFLEVVLRDGARRRFKVVKSY
jgi:hypothetical protein